jgi:hypothetical protein
MDCRIADELIAMAELDRKVADELATSGALYEGYDPRMAAIHEKNALRLQAIMAQIGWPTERLVGKRAAKAAWLIAQHAISQPEFQRSCLKLLAEAARERMATCGPTRLRIRKEWMNDVALWVSNLSLKFLLVQNRSHCQPTVNGLNTTIRSGSLKSAGADVRSQIRGQHEPAWATPTWRLPASFHPTGDTRSTFAWRRWRCEPGSII